MKRGCWREGSMIQSPLKERMIRWDGMIKVWLYWSWHANKGE
jgi:hypothetical protein